MNSRRDEEIAASVAARRDLGSEYDDAIAAGLVERIGAEVDRRVDERISQYQRGGRQRRPRGQQRSSGQPASAAPASRPPRPSDLLAAGQPGPRLHGGRHDYVGEHQHRPRKWNLADHRHVDRHHVHQWSHLPRRPPLPTRPPLPRLTARQGATPSSSFRQGWPTGLPWLVLPGQFRALPRPARSARLHRASLHAECAWPGKGSGG